MEQRGEKGGCSHPHAPSHVGRTGSLGGSCRLPELVGSTQGTERGVGGGGGRFLWVPGMLLCSRLPPGQCERHRASPQSITDAAHTLTLPRGSKSPHRWFFAAGKRGSTQSHQPTHGAQLNLGSGHINHPHCHQRAVTALRHSPFKSPHSQPGLGHCKGKNKAKKLFSSRQQGWIAARSSAALPARPRTAQRALRRPEGLGGARGVGGAARDPLPMLDTSAHWDVTGGEVPPGPWLPGMHRTSFCSILCPILRGCFRLQALKRLKIPAELPRLGPQGPAPASRAG